ncbi:FxsA family protein [Serinicoccus hydrothermalis]|nr:FxsA family protein [Serinicoccus hydrothermalis]
MSGPPQQARRRRPVLRWILLALVLLPIIEIAVLIMVGRAVGLWWTLALIIVVAVAGTWLARRESSRTYRELQQALNSGRMPADQVTDAILLTVGGLLLLLPGFVSDVIALVLILPFTRPLARRLLQAVVASRALATVGGSPAASAGRSRRAPGAGTVIDGEIVDEQPPPWQQERPPQIDR